ncbi:MFS transporter [Nostoc sp. 'Peltigera malacea cyanobiont' DB3992]|uniref:MFS transporter n=1 Tax=Nostoc sp. 'Peltigera malacea cyanobiont' DB3992 TaxID=1206980 RepID=UPI000C047D98|nr:MFS transporter [Nostoc sp. 'Peltigera malacea cyanobiont' DB3992]PHM09812.1 MFS transporter [Nostoc sp. 'Peltigera malacea cyanobiont' DB3992]
MEASNKSQIMLRAFSSRNFRLYYTGQAISLIGTSMTQVATSWLVYRLTDSAWLLGLVGFASQIPTLLLIPLGGIIADRWNRHQILLVAQILGMLQSLALTWLALSGTINIKYIAILGVLQGIINAFDIPTRQAFLPETVGKENLGNAFALYSSLVSVTSMLGPAIAGLLIVALGSGLCFLIDSISYIAVIIALLAIRLTSRKAIISTRQPLEELKTSFKYAFGFLPIRSVLIGSALVCCVWGFYLALGPIFAKDILQGGPNTFGFLMTASSLGTLAGGIYLTKHSNVLESGKVLALGIGFMGVSLIVFALSRVFWLSLLSLFAAGFGFILQIIAGRTLLQLLVSDENRGQITGLYVMASTGAVPIGNLIAGALASKIGSSNTVIFGASICIAGSILFMQQISTFRDLIRLNLRTEGT